MMCGEYYPDIVKELQDFLFKNEWKPFCDGAYHLS